MFSLNCVMQYYGGHMRVLILFNGNSIVAHTKGTNLFSYVLINEQTPLTRRRHTSAKFLNHKHYKTAPSIIEKYPLSFEN